MRQLQLRPSNSSPELKPVALVRKFRLTSVQLVYPTMANILIVLVMLAGCIPLGGGGVQLVGGAAV